MRKRFREMMTRPSDLAFSGGLGLCLGLAVLLVIELIAGWRA